MVWRLSLPPGRVIQVRPASNKVHGFTITSEIATTKIKVVTSIPVHLHAVRDSRYVALKHYHVAFKNHPRIPNTFFDYDHDHLHISLQLLEALFNESDMSPVDEKTLSKVVRLLIGPICQLSPLALDTRLMGFFKCLKQIVLPHRYLMGDIRRVRNENAGKHHFKNARRTKDLALPGTDIEYKTPKEILEMSRDLR